MNKTLLLMSMISLLLLTSLAHAQTDDPPRYEVAAELTTLNRDGLGTSNTDLGFGTRFTFNFNKYVAAEGSGYFFPGKCFNYCINPGRVLEAMGGIKAGKRFKSWGVFAKARPGVVTISQGRTVIIQTGTTGSFPFEIQFKSLDNFATDLGGVVEFYPSRRIVTRFDFGDTLIHFGRRTDYGFSFDPATNVYTPVPFTTPAKTTHNFQFSASVGFRF